VGGDDKFKTLDLGASYDFGPAKVSGYITQSRAAGLKVANYYVGAQVPIGPGFARVSYVTSNLSGTTSTGVNTDPNDARQFAIGYLYNLSKRTALYSNLVRVTNQGASAIAVDKNPTLAAGKASTGLDFGLRHSF
jgi:predicted porin